MAQVFVRRYPQMTRSLALSHTSPPDPVDGDKIRQAMWWLSLMPERTGHVTAVLEQDEYQAVIQEFLHGQP